MKAANSSGTNGSTWHIYTCKTKNVNSLCGKKQIKRVGNRNWVNAETVEKVQKYVDNKIGDLCQSCKNKMKKRKEAHNQ